MFTFDKKIFIYNNGNYNYKRINAILYRCKYVNRIINIVAGCAYSNYIS